MNVWVIIPAYNAGPFLQRTLESLVEQSTQRWRAVVVDDGSLDNTAEIASRFGHSEPRVHLVRQENAGVAAARNRGAAEALLDPDCWAMLFLDADDVLFPTALAVLADRLEAVPAASAAHGLARYIDQWDRPLYAGAGEAWGRRRQVPRGLWVRTLARTEDTTFSSLVCVHGLATPGVVLIRRSAFERTDGYDLATPETSDWAMAVALSRAGPLAYIDDVVLGYRQHGTNMAGNIRKMQDATRRAWQRAWRDPSNTPEHRRAMARGYRSLHIYMAFKKLTGLPRHFRSPKTMAYEAAYGARHVGRAVRGHP